MAKITGINNLVDQEQIGSLQGPTGKSAYDEAVEEGFTGTKSEWLLSIGGDPGSDGESATITIGSVQTINSNENVIVENIGTPKDALLNISIPRGPVGPTGPNSTNITILKDSQVLGVANQLNFQDTMAIDFDEVNHVANILYGDLESTTFGQGSLDTNIPAQTVSFYIKGITQYI